MIDMSQENDNVEVKTPVPYSISEIEKKLRSFSRYEEMAEKQKGLQLEIDSLIKEKDRFLHVFKTDRGSIYFQTGDGVARIKKNEKGYWDFQFVNHHIFYISQTDAEELTKMLEIEMSYQLGEQMTNEDFSRRAGENSENMCNKPIKVFELQDGMYPLDFEFNKNWEIAYRLNNNVLEILGNEFGHLGGSGLHIGDKIVEILK